MTAPDRRNSKGKATMPHRRIVPPLAGLAALLSWSTPAAADDNYGAIAFSQDSGNYGYAIDYDSRRSAEADALKECGDGCEVVVWFKNACGALATGDDNGYGTGWASNHADAEDIAMSACNKNSSNCSVLRWQCTTR
jgi:Domain of unknown function (DUF4189)